MAIVPSSSGPPAIAGGLNTPRVQRALQELRQQLDEAATLAGQLRRAPAPTITAVHPTTAFPGELVRMEIKGTDFQDSPLRVSLRRESGSPGPASRTASLIEGKEIFFVNDRILLVTFDLDHNFEFSGDPPSSIWSVEVVNADGGVGLAKGLFTVRGLNSDAPRGATAPALSGGQPMIIRAAQAAPGGNGALVLTISGVQLPDKPSVRLIHDDRATIVAANPTTNSERTEIRATFEMSPTLARESPWSVAVTGADGSKDFMPDCLDVPVI